MRNFTDKFINYALTIVILGCFTASANARNEGGGQQTLGHSNLYGKVTPSEVYSLLNNYETLFVYYLDNHKKELSAELKAINLKPVTGKTPEDAFVKLGHLSDSIDRLTGSVQLEPMSRISREKKKAIPAEVFLQAGNSLDAFVKFMNKLEPNKNWGDFYVSHQYESAKKPDDVYAFADLSVRRLDLVLRRGNTR